MLEPEASRTDQIKRAKGEAEARRVAQEMTLKLAELAGVSF